jgi:hypothetical protein
VPSDELDDDTAAAISEVSQSRDGSIRVKMAPKESHLQALEEFHEIAKPAEVEVETRPTLMPTEVAYAVVEVIGKAEAEAGVAPRDGLSLEERVKRVRAVGGPLPPSPEWLLAARQRVLVDGREVLAVPDLDVVGFVGGVDCRLAREGRQETAKEPDPTPATWA